jgi:hypothetical protein
MQEVAQDTILNDNNVYYFRQQVPVKPWLLLPRNVTTRNSIGSMFGSIKVDCRLSRFGKKWERIIK